MREERATDCALVLFCPRIEGSEQRLRNKSGTFANRKLGFSPRLLATTYSDSLQCRQPVGLLGFGLSYILPDEMKPATILENMNVTVVS